VRNMLVLLVCMALVSTAVGAQQQGVKPESHTPAPEHVAFSASAQSRPPAKQGAPGNLGISCNKLKTVSPAYFPDAAYSDDQPISTSPDAASRAFLALSDDTDEELGRLHHLARTCIKAGQQTVRLIALDALEAITYEQQARESMKEQIARSAKEKQTNAVITNALDDLSNYIEKKRNEEQKLADSYNDLVRQYNQLIQSYQEMYDTSMRTLSLAQEVLREASQPAVSLPSVPVFVAPQRQKPISCTATTFTIGGSDWSRSTIDCY
jgi:methyl-accepting chemotaxis protein